MLRSRSPGCRKAVVAAADGGIAAGGAAMAFIYSFVARGTLVLADYTSYSGNFSTVAIQCLQKCPASQPGDPPNKVTFNADRHTFNYLVDSGYGRSSQTHKQARTA